jgi:anti-anti-sigma regulatory factor
MEDLMNRLSWWSLWTRMVTPREVDADLARQEYTVRIILSLLVIFMAVASVVFIPLFLAGMVSYAFPMSGVLALAFFGGGLWWTDRGYWRITAYLPALVVYLAALYGNILQGTATGSVMFYLLAVLLVGIVGINWAQWAAAGICFVTYLAIGLAVQQGYLHSSVPDPNPLARWSTNFVLALGIAVLLQQFINRQLEKALLQTRSYLAQLTTAHAQLVEEERGRQAAQEELQVAENERLLAERNLLAAEAARAQLLEQQASMQQEMIAAQQRVLKELSTPIIPVLDQVIIMPLIGAVDSLRAKDLTRALLAGIQTYQAKVVILDITGVSIIDSGVANHLNKTIQTARLKGARTIVTGVSDAVAETIVELGIDWSDIETRRNLQSGLMSALESLGYRIHQ